MSGKTGIQWTDETWNPVVGCTRVSAGCDHCYAFQLHDQRHVAWKRGRWETAPEQYHKPFSQVQLLPERLMDPLHWRTPRRVFVNSMSDLFHDDVPDEFIARVFTTMANCPHHTFQVLTKRPERMRRWVSAHDAEWRVGLWLGRPTHLEIIAAPPRDADPVWPLPNVHLGTSMENQDAARERMFDLLATPAAVRFVSAEPLLGGLTLHMRPGYLYTAVVDPIRSTLMQLDWLIVGGESGPHARPLDPHDPTSLRPIYDLVAQCRAAEVPVFVKQLGSVWAHQAKGRHPHGSDPAQWPDDLRIREWPRAR